MTKICTGLTDVKQNGIKNLKKITRLVLLCKSEKSFRWKFMVKNLWSKVRCWGAAWADMVDTRGWCAQMFAFTCDCGRWFSRVCRLLPLGFPARFRGPPFDSDGSWEPGDIRGCNNINALHQVFTSGTRLGIINTYTLFASTAGANHHGAPWMLPSPFLCPSVLPSCPPYRPQFGKRARAAGKNGAGNSELHIIYLHLASA